jgi:hypothetical protein
MNKQGHIEIVSLTTDTEKINRFDHIVSELMGKYFDLVWLARKDEDELIKEERYEILKTIRDIEAKYPQEVKELYECESNWQHGFNSGMLACLRFLSEYIKDDLWPLEDTGGVDFPEEEIKEMNGRKYVQFDGREQAKELFPELDT